MLNALKLRKRAPPRSQDGAEEINELRREVAELERKIVTIERLLLGLHGPGSLGGSKPPAPEPEPVAPRLKPVATLPGGVLTINGSVAY